MIPWGVRSGFNEFYLILAIARDDRIKEFSRVGMVKPIMGGFTSFVKERIGILRVVLMIRFTLVARHTTG
jgi:hypothetical protein